MSISLRMAWLVPILAGLVCLTPGVQGADLAASAPPTHRPLREDPPPALPEPTEPQVFNGYPGAPAFAVVPRKPHLLLYPCSQCHNLLPLNAQPRKLANAPHQAALTHGNGRFWCLDCHQAKDREFLHTIGGAKVDFDQSYLVCGQCHSARQRDWYFGAHGKRVAGWQGERELYACTHCHDPHKPSITPRPASHPPPVRAGLLPMQREHEARPLPWQKTSEGADHVQAVKP
jgi:hypothetical protein